MFLTKDNLILGVVLGMLAPFLGLLGFYFGKFSALSFTDFLQFLVIYKTLFTAVISVSLIVNAGIFTLYINLGKDKTAIGIFAATCIYAIVCIVLKFWL
ncbi:hypothetical protein ACFOW1_08130 [Parasediminibacterium paludis]|uniref:DUF3796 domain-containing protein n=1 Tax=Parasediminibacterium paludis TaxID=908966 RepID=A0ABV8PX40_9BACT